MSASSIFFVKDSCSNCTTGFDSTLGVFKCKNCDTLCKVSLSTESLIYLRKYNAQRCIYTLVLLLGGTLISVFLPKGSLRFY